LQVSREANDEEDHDDPEYEERQPWEVPRKGVPVKAKRAPRDPEESVPRAARSLAAIQDILRNPSWER
jgi:hypothetical protein